MNTSGPAKNATKGQISCGLCQKRKVRCDKGNPCSTCQRAGVKCEVSSRQRLPRGRNGGRRKGDLDLKARLAKLENLVSSLGESESSTTALPTFDRGQVNPEPTSAKSSSDMSRYIGSSFWSTLTNEVSTFVAASTVDLQEKTIVVRPKYAICNLVTHSLGIKEFGLSPEITESLTSLKVVDCRHFDHHYVQDMQNLLVRLADMRAREAE